MSLRGNRETTLIVIRFWVELEGIVAMEEVLLANESKAFFGEQEGSSSLDRWL